VTLFKRKQYIFVGDCVIYNAWSKELILCIDDCTLLTFVENKIHFHKRDINDWYKWRWSYGKMLNGQTGAHIRVH
jgi:hypothetical protein